MELHIQGRRLERTASDCPSHCRVGHRSRVAPEQNDIRKIHRVVQSLSYNVKSAGKAIGHQAATTNARQDDANQASCPHDDSPITNA